MLPQRQTYSMLKRLQPHIVEKPWGRTDIPATFGQFGGRRIGEIWFTDPDGGDLPILAKFLFTSERLSIQVHPDDAAARTSGLPNGKDECWFVLCADEAAEIGVGLNRASDTEALRAAATDGSIEGMMNWRPVKTGDFIYNPARTIHAIGPGLIVAEIQQNLDLTYRLYDYGRPRELHLDEGLAVAIPGPHSDARDTHVASGESRRLTIGPHFHLLHLSGKDYFKMLPPAFGEYMLLPLAPGCSVASEAVELGECVLTDCAIDISLAPGASALLCWSA